MCPYGASQTYFMWTRKLFRLVTYNDSQCSLVPSDFVPLATQLARKLAPYLRVYHVIIKPPLIAIMFNSQAIRPITW